VPEANKQRGLEEDHEEERWRGPYDDVWA